MPTNATELLRLMDMGGGLERQLTHPLYSDKLKDIEFETLRSWVHELAERDLITKVRGTGLEKIDGKWFSLRMTEVHGTLGCLAVAGAAELDDLRALYPRGLTYEIGSGFVGWVPSNCK